MTCKVFAILTSDGTRNLDLDRAVNSLLKVKNVHIYFVNQSKDSVSFNSDRINVIDVNGKVPLSVARNLALKEVYSIASDLDRVIFSDDDGWYPHTTLTFASIPSDYIHVYPVLDPKENKFFSRRKKIDLHCDNRCLSKQELFDYACSISLNFPIKFVRGQYFNERLGLGNVICQGEESEFLFEVCDRNNCSVVLYSKHYVFHPYKNSYPPQVFYALSYFLTYSIIRRSRFFLLKNLFKLIGKYTFACVISIFSRGRSYRKILFNILSGISDAVNKRVI